MDATPPADIPDPTSPTPSTPRPVQVGEQGAAVGRAAKIRSMPTSATRAARLPGTYAANFGGDDMDWRRGLTILWVLMGLTAGLEIVRAVLGMLAELGGPAVIGAIRVGVSTAVFLALWLGRPWLRWGLVVYGFCVGLYLTVWGLAANAVWGSGFPADTTVAEGSWLLTQMPEIALGLLYLATAAYVAFSADVVDFVRHHHEKGRGWVLAPLAVLGLLYVGTFCLLEVPYRLRLARLYSHARDFGDETTRRMAARWDPKSIEGLGDARFNRGWSDDYRRRVFASLAPLGPNENLGTARLHRLPSLFVPAEGGVIRQYAYSLTQARFAHGSADLDVVLSKPLFRPWQIDDLQINDVRYDPKPTPVPEPTPTPTAEAASAGE